MKCYVHSDTDSVGVCTRCGKSVCGQCSMELNEKLVCKSCAENMINTAAKPQAQPPSQPQPYTAQSYSPPAYSAQSTSPPPGQSPAKRKEPLLSLILSFFIPGLGQVYNGQLLKGVIILVLYVALWMISGVLMFVLIGFCTMVLPVLVWLYAMYDGYSVANRINRGEIV